ncbi:BON domain-containing protein [Streptomyces sp. NPDC006553]|uniref:BON domain-containing protein n=1 Tax=unclassified Streptomyces TaxID=2593676 RepID=UPI00224F08B2|nr:BON domain-containing protein [Streptomyces sp. NBC_00233]MCX5232516.1 BON domain-containing protein [Streptomyces sp. NBC_00233]
MSEHAAYELEYRLARVRDRLAGDDVAELGVRVELRGDAVLLSGTVPTAARRDEILRLARIELAGLTVLDDLASASGDAPERMEELS